MTLKILSNAIKFSNVDATVEISDKIQLRQNLLIKISDTGIGIIEDEVAIALEPFSQEDDSLTRANDATGLGLPLVKLMLKLHGGALFINSTKGQGTRVGLMLMSGAERQRH